MLAVLLTGAAFTIWQRTQRGGKLQNMTYDGSNNRQEVECEFVKSEFVSTVWFNLSQFLNQSLTPVRSSRPKPPLFYSLITLYFHSKRRIKTTMKKMSTRVRAFTFISLPCTAM